ncbi:hypothetical protein E2C01_064754 [Portunus trituberculatus]|uniref:Uncharacterized protein n=1 Tax=Portunus trituberculatus TaxID=210409 RepID=A0A5B7HPN5_PORTR|nr:hypothetical protein [Portunus trituberculatus]
MLRVVQFRLFSASSYPVQFRKNIITGQRILSGRHSYPSSCTTFVKINERGGEVLTSAGAGCGEHIP